MTNRKLRAVSEGEKAESVEPARALTVVEAAEANSRLDELKAMRLRLARAIDNPNTQARDLAALTRRQLEIGREIDAILIQEDEDQSVVANDDDEVWDGTGY